MKKARKLTAFLLLAAFVFTFIVPVTAMATGETGTITVDNPQKDQTYTAYKIFDVVYDTTTNSDGQTVAGNNYSYTIDSSNPWFTTVQTYAGTESNGLKLEQITGSTKYNVTVTSDFSAPKFAAALKEAAENVTDKNAKTLTGNADAVSVSDLPLGYYFVTSTSGALCNLTTTNAEVTIHDKNEVVFEKTDDKQSVEIGETVTYTIKGKVPDTTGFTSYDYVITDKMSNGLDFNANSINVYISNDDKFDTTNDNSTLDGKYYELSTSNAKSFDETKDVDFRINFKAIDMNKANPSLVGKYIFITYTATVNKNAVATVEKNDAKLIFSNDPTDATKHDNRDDNETVYSAKIDIDKYAANSENANDQSNKLANAEFILYRYGVANDDGTYSFVKNADTGVTYTKDDANVTKFYYKATEVTEEENTKVTNVEWTRDKAQATKRITDSDGAATFVGLEDGQYYLEETKAPDGYNLLKDPVAVKIDGKDATVDNTTPLTVNQPVANSTGSLLPSTGGIGTTIFYAVGAVLVVGAGVLLVTKRRMSGQR